MLPNFRDLLTKSPRQIVEAARRAGIPVTGRWWESWQIASLSAYAAVKRLKLDTMARLIALWDELRNSDISVSERKSRIISELTSMGVLKKDSQNAAYRLKQMVAYQTLGSSAKSQWEAAQARNEPLVVRYVTKDDHLVRPHHAAFHFKVFSLSDPILSYIWAPNGHRCRCRMEIYTLAEAAALGLVVESTTGRIQTTQVDVGGQLVNVTGLEIDGQIVHPDPGWDFNPGQRIAPHPIDYTKYPSELAAQGIADRHPWVRNGLISGTAIAALLGIANLFFAEEGEKAISESDDKTEG